MMSRARVGPSPVEVDGRNRVRQDRTPMRWVAASLSCLALVTASLADGPADNRPENVRRIPKVGIEVPPGDRKALEDGLASLARAIEPLRAKKDARTAALLPDVQVFHKAVHDALVHQEFFDPRDIAKA